MASGGTFEIKTDYASGIHIISYVTFKASFVSHITDNEKILDNCTLHKSCVDRVLYSHSHYVLLPITLQADGNIFCDITLWERLGVPRKSVFGYLMSPATDF